MNEETKNAEETQGNGRPWTPGPWEYVTAQKGYPYEPTKEDLLRYVSDCWDDSEGTGWGITRSDANGVVICIFGNGPTTEPNAHLIAAAPELFEALERILLFSESHELSGQYGQAVLDELFEIETQARAAIEKAEGGQP